MSDFDRGDTDSNAREARLTGQRMDEIRDAEWSARREDRDSLRGSLERATESFDDPPETKIDLNDEPFDRYKRHGDIRSGIAASIDESFFNSANAERRERYIGEFDQIDQQLKRSHGVDGVTGIKQMIQVDAALRSPDFQTRVNAINHMVELAHNESPYREAVQYRTQEAATKEVEAWFKKHQIGKTPEERAQIENLMGEYLSSPGAKRTGNFDADLKHAFRQATAGAKRVQFR
jgi:hypothetical protein